MNKSNLFNHDNKPSIACTELKPSKKKLKVIVLDNEVATLIALRSLLETMGHEVTTFSCSQRTIESVRTNTFDIALIDYRLPGSLNGIDVIKKILTLNPNIKCFLVTGDNSIDCSRFDAKIINKPLTIAKINQIFAL